MGIGLCNNCDRHLFDVSFCMDLDACITKVQKEFLPLYLVMRGFSPLRLPISLPRDGYGWTL